MNDLVLNSRYAQRENSLGLPINKLPISGLSLDLEPRPLKGRKPIARAQGPDRRRLRDSWIVRLAGLLLVAWIGGFVIFATSLKHAGQAPARADAIVVLTGGQRRLSTGIALLEQHKARRLLVSGVNEKTTKEDIRKLVSAPQDLFDCCVDIDYAAKDTVGNARHTAEWVAEHGITSLIVVTANYHMPRTLLEFHKALKDVALYPVTVESDHMPTDQWWREASTGFFLFAEYNKYLASALRVKLTK